MTNRKAPPLSLKVHVALLQLGYKPEHVPVMIETLKRAGSLYPWLVASLKALGLDPATAILDHEPPLSFRLILPDGSYDPPDHDPAHLQWLSRDSSDVKTYGAVRGNGKATVADSDIHKAAKIKRLRAALVSSREIAKEPEKPKRKFRWPTRKIQSRGFRQ